MKSKQTVVNQVHSIEDYKNFISGSNEKRHLSAEVISFRITMEKLLMDDGSDLTLYLQRLSEEDKILLITALLKNDQDLLNEILSPIFPSKSDAHSKLQNLTKHGQLDAEEQWLNKTCLALFKRLFQNAAGDQLPETECQRMLSWAMKKIPNTLIDLPSKLAMHKTIIPTPAYTRLGYREEPNPLVKNKFTGNIKLDEFIFATNAPDLDTSEYLFLTLGLLQKHALKNEHINQQLSQCRQLYTETNYEDALSLITDLCNDYQNEIGREECTAILDAQTKLSEVSTYRNYSRRFFENRVALLYQGQGIGADVIEGINRIAIEFLKDKMQLASSPQETLATTLKLAELGIEDIKEKESKLKQDSTDWEQRSRYTKEGIRSDYKRSKGKKSEIIMTRNMGMMRSSQPNFPDELSNHPLENKGPDIYNTSEDFYQLKRKRSTFIASISGHGFLAAAILLTYLERNPTCSTNNQDINHFLKVYASVYVSQSFHSLLEVMDVFNQPHIKKRFEDYGVTIDTRWPDFILEQAFKDTQEYTKKLCKQRVVLEQLSSRLSVAIEQGNLSEVESLLEQHHDPNTVSSQGLTPFIIALKKRNRPIINKLIEAGADPTLSLFIAIKKQDLEMVRTIIQYEIDIRRIYEGLNLLECAIQYGNKDICKEISGALRYEINANKMKIDQIKEDPSNIPRQQEIEHLKTLAAHVFELDISEGLDSFILLERRLNEFLLLDSVPLPLSKEQGEQEIEGRPFLFVAIENNRDDLVEAALDVGADPDPRLTDGTTPLGMAAEKNNGKLMDMLIKAGARVDQSSDSCNSPLAIAVLNGHKEAAKILIAAGAEPNVATVDGIDLITLAIQNRDLAMANLLQEHGVSFSQQDKENLLVNAVYDNNIDEMQFLISLGASPDTIYSTEPALCIAARNGFVEAVETLLKAKANPDAYCYYEDDYQNYNALQLAIINGYIDIVAILLEHDVNLMFKDLKGLTMIELAREHNHPLIAQLIEEFLEQKMSSLTDQINNINETPDNTSRQAALIALKEFADEIAKKTLHYGFLEARIGLFTQLDAQYERFLKLLSENKIQRSKIVEVKNRIDQEFTNLKEDKNLFQTAEIAKKTIDQAIFQSKLRLFDQNEEKPDASSSDKGIKNNPSNM